MAETSLVRQRSYKNNSEADRARFAEELEGAGPARSSIAARLNIGVKKSQAESSFSLVSAEERAAVRRGLRAEECPDRARAAAQLDRRQGPARQPLRRRALLQRLGRNTRLARASNAITSTRRRILPQSKLAIPMRARSTGCRFR